jgi:hypothetical protein
MAVSTRFRMAGLTPYAFRMTFETAARDTPASSATSEMDGRLLDLESI